MTYHVINLIFLGKTILVVCVPGIVAPSVVVLWEKQTNKQTNKKQ